VSHRVVVWGTGNVGRHALAGIDARPDLELVGVWVSSEAKVGRTPANWPGSAAAGGDGHPRRRRHSGPRPDCMVHTAMADNRLMEALDDLARLLRRRHQRGLQRTGVPAVPRRCGTARPMIEPGSQRGGGRRGVAVGQRDRPRLRQRLAAPGADVGVRADRRGALLRDPQLRHLQPGHGDLRHHGLRAPPRRHPHAAPAHSADHGVGQRGAAVGRRARRRARRRGGELRAAAGPETFTIASGTIEKGTAAACASRCGACAPGSRWSCSST
jgi:hypothetical protein